MPRDIQASLALKEQGNVHFKANDFVSAEGHYSKAIIADDSNAALYTNRAHARLKLQLYEDALVDCNTCMDIDPSNMKPYYLSAQCLLALKQYDDALSNATRALDMSSETNNKSLPQLTALVLQCRTARWNEKEKRRKREHQDLEAELLALMVRERNDMVAAASGNQFEQKEISEEWNHKTDMLKAIFEKAREASEKQREVPPWAIDDINFGIMVEPVVTKSGKSFEKASILESLKHKAQDPITREFMTHHDLRPNLALKAACSEFLEENGWAADW